MQISIENNPNSLERLLKNKRKPDSRMLKTMPNIDCIENVLESIKNIKLMMLLAMIGKINYDRMMMVADVNEQNCVILGYFYEW
jgi:hypothetical protein